MEKVLITGSGMVAAALMKYAPEFGFEPHALTHSQADIRDRDALIAAARAVKPFIIFHTAAETRVNYCEDHGEESLLVNGIGTTNAGCAAAECNAELVYISTDYVFSGERSAPWLESDEPDPVNAYGVSKLMGEIAAQSYELGYIVRTSGVFGKRSGGKAERNFFRTIAAKLAEGTKPIEVVDDQFTSVTYAPHLARMLFKLASLIFPRIAHLTSAGEDSWFGWARRTAEILGHDPERIKPVATTQSDGVARRPRYSVLGSELPEIAEMKLGFPAEDGLKEYLGTQTSI